MGKKRWGLNFQEREQREVRVKGFLENKTSACASKADSMWELDHKSAARDKMSSWAEISTTYKIIFSLETWFFFLLTEFFCVLFIPLINFARWFVICKFSPYALCMFECH